MSSLAVNINALTSKPLLGDDPRLPRVCLVEHHLLIGRQVTAFNGR